jgi:23S rRNA (adenine1618-N6)-methyltransferase
MMEKKDQGPEEKSNLHPRNKHRQHYDFNALIESSKELTPYVIKNKYGNRSINFSDPKAVIALNRALLKLYYDITFWSMPDGYLCPAIPGRADYIHYIADLLAGTNAGVIPQGDHVLVFDIGVGANCVYPIIGRKEYGWKFIASDIDEAALNSAKKIITSNKLLVHEVDCRLQSDPQSFFKNVIKKDEMIDVVICNPPFHHSAEAAAYGTEKKNKNLGSKRVADGTLNFGGQTNELIYKGGEVSFIYYLILESKSYAGSCLWFTTLVSDKDHLTAIYKNFEKAGALDVKTINIAQGQKKSRIVAWTFLNKEQQKDWAKKRFQVSSSKF